MNGMKKAIQNLNTVQRDVASFQERVVVLNDQHEAAMYVGEFVLQLMAKASGNSN